MALNFGKNAVILVVAFVVLAALGLLQVLIGSLCCCLPWLTGPTGLLISLVVLAAVGYLAAKNGCDLVEAVVLAVLVAVAASLVSGIALLFSRTIISTIGALIGNQSLLGTAGNASVAAAVSLLDIVIGIVVMIVLAIIGGAVGAMLAKPPAKTAAPPAKTAAPPAKPPATPAAPPKAPAATAPKPKARAKK